MLLHLLHEQPHKVFRVVLRLLSMRRPATVVRRLICGAAMVRPLLLRRAMLRSLSTRQIDVYPSFVLLGFEFEAHLVAQTLDTWLDLLHVAGRVMPLAHNRVQVALSGRQV